MVSLAHGAAFKDELTEKFAPRWKGLPHLDFGYLFPDLQKPEHQIIETPGTQKILMELGKTMVKTDADEGEVSDIPAAYTYLGQFIAHDVTSLNLKSRPANHPASCDFEQGGPSTLVKGDITKLINERGAQLQLDSVYNEALRTSSKRHLKLGNVSFVGDKNDKPIFFNDWALDIPRKKDRSPDIADPRNDNNVIVSQLHVAFLRAHNSLVDLALLRGIAKSDVFEHAATQLRQHYHWIVVHDFLKLIAEERIVDDILNGNVQPLTNLEATSFVLPLEFTAAAYRFGHSMIRPSYYYNDNRPSSSINDLIPKMLMFDKSNAPTSSLPDNRVIDWNKFVCRRKSEVPVRNANFARRIVPALTEQMMRQVDETGAAPLACQPNLAVIDLLRGFTLNLPTGQAVVDYLNTKNRNIRKLSAAEIESAAEKRSFEQAQLLRRSDFELSKRTPLWYYLLAEAEIIGGGMRLGPVGSTIVAEVLIALVRRSPNSILSSTENFSPVPTASGKFQLADLLRLGRVLA